MPNSLIIVESPTKVKTIRKIVGNDFDVRATMGHIKDLPKKSLGIDINNGFEPKYTTIEGRRKVVEELRKAARGVDHIYLAPDPDREGEAIAWHVAHEVGGNGKVIHRVLFNDLTKKTVLEALKNPRSLDVNKYEAQQTRRILDRLVGYKISPLLWEKIKMGLSAGRVQSVAVRLICEREEEIRAFKPEEYWNIFAKLEAQNPPPLEAKLIRIDRKKARVQNAEEAQRITEEVKNLTFTVLKVDRRETKRSPQPPFTTSKLQQEAARALGFSAKKTMNLAQRLYEGVELGPEGSVGLITYMRTDSVRTADEALEEVREYIKANYNSEFLPPKPVIYKNPSTAQDAHEAIRPASLKYKPQDIKKYLSTDLYRLYLLIWNRFIASQMTPALFDQTTIDCIGGPYIFRAQGSIMKFPGYTVIYRESKDENEKDEKEEYEDLLPECSPGETLKLLQIRTEQKFTQPPPRYSEATLVKELEEKGIGRPSTYATILSTIQERHYVRLENGRFVPTELGMLVTKILVEHFPRIIDVSFTAQMENELDQIEEGKLSRIETLTRFYNTFEQELKKAEETIQKIKLKGTPVEITCDKCAHKMTIKWGKNGEFLACSNFPKCRNTMNFTRDSQGNIVPEKTENIETEHKCDKCGKPIILKKSRFGTFLGCSGYPDCKNVVSLKQKQNVQAEQSETCELCGRPFVLRRSRFGTFLGCSGYPECKNIKKIT
ncbi:MAG: type I DNA topoisomerase [Syntrophales bacterium]|nr:type I DNA topoisomerase [Syntrophales bacterium]